MPIDNISVENPYDDSTLDEAWAYCSHSSFSWADKTSRLIYDVFANREAAYSGKPPIRQIEFNLTPEDRPAEYRSILVSEGVPAVYDNTDPENSILVSPAVAPVYSQELVRPALPGLLTLLASHAEVYAELTEVIDTLVMTQSPFNSGELEEVE